AGLERDPSTVTADELALGMEARGVPPALVREVETELRACETARYSESDVEEGRGERWRALVMKLRRYLLLWLAGWAFVGSFGQLRAQTWHEAERLFEQALVSDDLEELPRLFAEAAFAFEAGAREGRSPGSGWKNAGNAWFQAGEVGRSILCFRRAEQYRPFDEELQASLEAARALVRDEVTVSGIPAWLSWPFPLPLRWHQAIVVLAWSGLWGVLLLRLRVTGRWFRIVSWGCVVLVVGGLLSALWIQLVELPGGVLIVDEVSARKGPGYRYESAFEGRLHEGLELRCGERRGEWREVLLADGRKAWLPQEAIGQIDETR
ncbi:MAG: hypothetical protein ACQKBU_11635, partial [Verrucomicrobiales bacterium]